MINEKVEILILGYILGSIITFIMFSWWLFKGVE